jgi:CRISPR/Cas system-associated endonuclease Cas1
MSNRRRKGDLISRLLSNRDKLRNNNRELSKKYSILKSRIEKALKIIQNNPIISIYEDNAQLILEIEKILKGSDK